MVSASACVAQLLMEPMVDISGIKAADHHRAIRTVVQAMSTADEQHIRREDWGCCAVCPALVLDGI